MANNPEDEAAIIALIHRNRIAIWTQDFDAYEQCFVHAPYVTRWNASRIGGIFIRTGWDDIWARVQRQFEDKTMCAPALAYDTRVEKLQLRIDGDMAWATFEQHYPAPPPKLDDGPTVTNELRIFERHDGAWRIAFIGFLTIQNFGFSEGPLLRLSADSTVLWKSPDADAALEADDDVVVRAGRLRIRDSRADQKLQAAVRWAAELDAQLVPGRGAMPIVLDGGEGVPMRVCWVIAESGTILFSLGDARLYGNRLAAAAVVFGLSPAQKAVAGYVAQGLALNEISERMTITVNTARTHLNRIFEKTGVHSQPALVRVLLSAGAPI